jgi:hypothetical protein
MGEIGGLVAGDDGAQRHDLGGLGEAAGRGEEARRQAERAGVQPLVQQRAHLIELAGGRGAVFEPHRHQPQRVVADQHAGIDRDRREGVEVLREAHLAERQPGRAAAQVIGEELRLAGQNRRDRKSAMADDLGRDALPDLAFGFRVDRQCEVGMGLDVDEAGGDRQARRVDDPLCRARQRRPDRGDAPTGDRQIPGLARLAAAVVERTAADQDVPLRHGHSPFPM